MPLDLDCTDPMYLLGRIVSTLEGSYPGSRGPRVADGGLIDILLVRPALGFSMLPKQFAERWRSSDVESIVAILPAAGLPKGPIGIEQQGPYWMGYYHQRSQNEEDSKITRKFDPATVRRVGETLFGEDHWQAEMTRALGLSDSSRVRAWISDSATKRRRVPAGVCRDLMVMLRHQSAAAKALADEIDAG